MKEALRPGMADLWKTLHAEHQAERQQAPAVSFSNVHGPVLSIVTNQPIQIADLWADMRKEKA